MFMVHKTCHLYMPQLPLSGKKHLTHHIINRGKELMKGLQTVVWPYQHQDVLTLIMVSRLYSIINRTPKLPTLKLENKW